MSSKPLGSQPTQLTPNDQLGRFAFLSELPPDVLAELQNQPWHFTDKVQIDDNGLRVGSKHVANKQHVQDVLNGASPIALAGGATVLATAEQLASRTLILTGDLGQTATLLVPSTGQWFVINRCTGPLTSSIVIRGAAVTNQVSLTPGENVTMYVDDSGVSLLAAPQSSFLNYYPFSASVGQTEFDFPYTPNLVLGFAGGNTYFPTIDYDASTGTKVVLKTPVQAAGVWVFVAFTATPISNAVPRTGGVMDGPLVLFNGSTAMTQPFGTNDPSIATMAALYKDRRVIAGVVDVPGTTFVLDTSLAGSLINLHSESGTAVALPDISKLNDQIWFDLVNVSAGGLASLIGLQPFNLMDPYTNKFALSYPMGSGESVRIVADPATGTWRLGVGLSKAQGRILAIKPYLVAGTYQYTRTPGTRKIIVLGAGAGAASAGLPACATGYVAVAQAGSVGAKAYAIFTANFDNAVITVGAGGPMVAANDDGQVGEDGGTSSFGTLLTIPGGKGGAFIMTNNAGGATAYAGLGAKQPSGQGIVTSSYGLLAPAAFVNTAGMFGGIERHGSGLEGYNNGLGGLGQVVTMASATPSSPTNPGVDGGFFIYELS